MGIFIFGSKNSVHGGFNFLVLFVMNKFQGFGEDEFLDDAESILELSGIGKILNKRGDLI